MQSVNWFRIYADLQTCGWHLAKIAKEIGIARTTLMGWKQGADPRHSDGELMISLWQQVTGKKRRELPLERKYKRLR